MNGKCWMMMSVMIGALAAAGCGSDADAPSGPSPTSTDLMPLKVGNQWSYNVEEFDTTGRQTSTKAQSNVVTADTMIQGTTWYFLNDDRATPTRTAGDGVYYWDTKRDASYRYIATPVSVGSFQEKGSQRFTVASSSARIDAPAGSYNSVQILVTDSNIPSVSSVISVAPGVGLVGLDVMYRRADGTPVTVSRWRLASMTLK